MSKSERFHVIKFHKNVSCFPKDLLYKVQSLLDYRIHNQEIFNIDKEKRNFDNTLGENDWRVIQAFMETYESDANKSQNKINNLTVINNHEISFHSKNNSLAFFSINLKKSKEKVIDVFDSPFDIIVTELLVLFKYFFKGLVEIKSSMIKFDEVNNKKISHLDKELLAGFEAIKGLTNDKILSLNEIKELNKPLSLFLTYQRYMK